MNRISNCFDKLKQQNRKALVTYVLSGDPTLSSTLPVMHAMVESGADIIELGVAFSDPIADGPTIQLGHERALANKATLRFTLDLVKQFRQQDNETPIVLMGYENPIERMGYENFAQTAAECGVDGVIVVDLPPEEAVDINRAFKAVGMENIFLLAPTTTTERVKKIVKLASGFLYYVSLKGVTGAGHLDVASVNQRLAEFRKLSDLPICVGFGIKNAESAQAVTEQADGAVVGSVLVDKMGSMAGQDDAAIAKALSEIITPMRQALDKE